MTGTPNLNILLAFDFGLRRIGVASGNLLTNTATPIATLKVGRELPWPELTSAIEEWNPGQLVVGQPDAERSGPVSALATEFAESLAERFGLPVARVDESLTSRTAESMLRDARESGVLKRRVKKGAIDSRAACLIAEQWMNSRRNEHH